MHLVFICGGNNFLKLWIHILPGCSKLPLLARLTLHKKKRAIALLVVKKGECSEWQRSKVHYY